MNIKNKTAVFSLITLLVAQNALMGSATDHEDTPKLTLARLEQLESTTPEPMPTDFAEMLRSMKMQGQEDGYEPSEAGTCITNAGAILSEMAEDLIAQLSEARTKTNNYTEVKELTKQLSMATRSTKKKSKAKKSAPQHTRDTFLRALRTEINSADDNIAILTALKASYNTYTKKQTAKKSIEDNTYKAALSTIAGELTTKIKHLEQNNKILGLQASTEAHEAELEIDKARKEALVKEGKKAAERKKDEYQKKVLAKQEQQKKDALEQKEIKIEIKNLKNLISQKIMEKVLEKVQCGEEPTPEDLKNLTIEQKVEILKISNPKLSLLNNTSADIHAAISQAKANQHIPHQHILHQKDLGLIEQLGKDKIGIIDVHACPVCGETKDTPCTIKYAEDQTFSPEEKRNKIILDDMHISTLIDETNNCLIGFQNNTNKEKSPLSVYNLYISMLQQLVEQAKGNLIYSQIKIFTKYFSDISQYKFEHTDKTEISKPTT
ncbi:MAG: DNA repair exonuclease SbcCD ATPase subunit [Alteromonas naphthalenivorans]|jgi:DNA repair exonuclease SbcCD ATPase subunit